jgi:hypothetical protein
VRLIFTGNYKTNHQQRKNNSFHFAPHRFDKNIHVSSKMQEIFVMQTRRRADWAVESDLRKGLSTSVLQ